MTEIDKMAAFLEDLEQVLVKHYGDDWHYDFEGEDPGLSIEHLTAGMGASC
jgi:hypothetical protein